MSDRRWWKAPELQLMKTPAQVVLTSSRLMEKLEQSMGS